MKNRVKLIICILFFAFSSISYAFSRGPISGRTGAPGEVTCVDCHDSFELNRGTGRVEILDLPKTYSPGQRIRVRVSVRQQNQQRWGFQLTALDEKETLAGQFSIIDAQHTQLINGGDRVYVEHTTEGTFNGNNGGAEWIMEWIAPSTDIGPVTFYAAGNAANGKNDTEGDFIYTTATLLGAPSDPIVTLTTPNGGEVLRAGEKFTIKWDSVNAFSHDLLVQLNGVNDIPKTIVTGLGGDIRDFQWQIPSNFATTQGRIIVVAQGSAGRADTDVSNRDFTIMPAEMIPGPMVSSVIVTDKKIKVTGTSFVSGTTVLVNGIGFLSAATIKGEGTTLIQKGMASNGSTIAELIPVGVPVRLRFTKPDGGVTETTYIRP